MARLIVALRAIFLPLPAKELLPSYLTWGIGHMFGKLGLLR